MFELAGEIIAGWLMGFLVFISLFGSVYLTVVIGKELWQWYQENYRG